MSKLLLVFVDNDFDKLVDEVYVRGYPTVALQPYLIRKVCHSADTTGKERGHHPLIFITGCQMTFYQQHN